jgi:hypothetical protein
MSSVKAVTAALAAAILLASPAAAVSVKNTSSEAFKIGVDRGNEEEVKTVAGNKSVTLDCADGCGVTGPWGYSWMASGDDTLSSDGKSRIVVADDGNAAEGASTGEGGSSGGNDPLPSGPAGVAD